MEACSAACREKGKVGLKSSDRRGMTSAKKIVPRREISATRKKKKEVGKRDGFDKRFFEVGGKPNARRGKVAESLVAICIWKQRRQRIDNPGQ